MVLPQASHMKKHHLIIIILLTIVLEILVADPFARRGRAWEGSGGWGVDSSYVMTFNPQSVETITGKVLSVQKFDPGENMSKGVSVEVRTSSGTVMVHLGPEWYIKRQDIKILPGEWVVITGSRVLFNRNPVIIASELRKANYILRLRDDTGAPFWTGIRRSDIK